MAISKLKTVEEVVSALGGPDIVAGFCETTPNVIWQWAYLGHFPARTHLVLTRELALKNAEAPDYLWRMVGAGEPPKRRKRK